MFSNTKGTLCNKLFMAPNILELTTGTSSRSILEKVIFTQLVDFTAVCGTLFKIHYIVHRSLSLVLALCHMKSLHILSPLCMPDVFSLQKCCDLLLLCSIPQCVIDPCIHDFIKQSVQNVSSNTVS